MAEYNDPRARLDPHVALSAHAEALFSSSPNVVLSVKVFVAAATAFVIVQIVRWAIQATPANPFARDERKQRKPYITDQKKRDDIVKQNFSVEKVRFIWPGFV
jgi:hypothetical protein